MVRKPFAARPVLSRGRLAASRPYLLAVVAGMTTLTASALSGQTAGDDLSYRVPSPAAATYRVTDTYRTEMTMPTGATGFELTAAMTLAATFEQDPGGVRFTGAVESFSATMAGPMGSQTIEDGVTGTFVFVLDPRGAVEEVSGPEIPEPAASAAPVAALAHEMFPRLPGTAVQPGDSWVDTVTWSAESPQGNSTTTTVYTYTLAGDTVVDGRMLLNIAITGEMETTGAAGPPGMQMDQKITGSHVGLALWDAERGALHSMEFARNYSGTMNSPMGQIPLKVSGSSRRWRENQP